MTRINAIDPGSATGKAKELLDGVQAALGITPNMMKTMANSPAVLEGYLSLNNALSHGSLTAKLREEIALAVGEENGCGYCVSAHTALGKMAGLDETEIGLARTAASGDLKRKAALEFAKAIVETKGNVGDDAFQKARNAGFDDGEIAEIVANVALNIFTNYFNQTAQTEIDFPKVELLTRSKSA